MKFKPKLMKKKEFIKYIYDNLIITTANTQEIHNDVISVNDNFFYTSTTVGYTLCYIDIYDNVKCIKSVSQAYKLIKKHDIDRDIFVDKVQQIKLSIYISTL
jgi:hypothetical protein